MVKSLGPQFEFSALEREERLSARAAEQIAHIILDQRLPVSAKLPSERQLAEALGVSRTVIREAIRLLEAKGLVEVRTGSGAVVRGISPEPVTESITMLLGAGDSGVSFEDVQTVRGVLEVAAAGLAAEKATPEDIARLEQAFARMVHAGTVEEQIQADYDFHLALAKATHNQVFVLLLQALIDILVPIWRAYWKAHGALGPADYIAADKEQVTSDMYHGQVLEAIRRGNASEAQQAMAQLLDHWTWMYKVVPSTP